MKKIVESMSKDLKALSIEEIFYIVNMLDAQKSAADLVLEYDFKAPPLPQGQVNWDYGLKVIEKEKTKINPKTFRPQSIIKNKNWEDALE